MTQAASPRVALPSDEDSASFVLAEVDGTTKGSELATHWEEESAKPQIRLVAVNPNPTPGVVGQADASDKDAKTWTIFSGEYWLGIGIGVVFCASIFAYTSVGS